MAVPTRPAASPPKACDNPVRSGTAVSGTRASGTPSAMPARAATAIHLYVTISGFSSVPPTASSMPVTAEATARRAVSG